jgi:peptidoglycan-associated lipoprotein
VGRAEIIALAFGGVGIGDLVWIDAALLPSVVERGAANEVVSAGLLSTSSGVAETTTPPRVREDEEQAPALAVAPERTAARQPVATPSVPPPPVASAPPDDVVVEEENVEVRFVQVGGAAVDETFSGSLDRVVERLQKEESLRVLVVGHADAQGSARVNWKLSKRRALAVERALVARGADARRIEVRWFGERKPAVRGRDDAAFAANRRADVLWRRSK